jgi:hypothetical protein
VARIKQRKINKYFEVEHHLVTGAVITYEINKNGVRRIGACENDEGKLEMVVEFDDFTEPVCIPEKELVIIS